MAPPWNRYQPLQRSELADMPLLARLEKCFSHHTVVGIEFLSRVPNANFPGYSASKYSTIVSLIDGRLSTRSSTKSHERMNAEKLLSWTLLTREYRMGNMRAEGFNREAAGAARAELVS